ncbi:MAG TPA: SRPBCC domain-containing protein [Planktothrix sp.]
MELTVNPNYPARCKGDVRVGGSMRLSMVASDGTEYPMNIVFNEIKEPERIVWLQDCSEHPQEWHEQVNKNRPGAAGNIGQMLLTITFEDFEAQTKITVRMQFENAADRDALIDIGMTEVGVKALKNWMSL